MRSIHAFYNRNPSLCSPMRYPFQLIFRRCPVLQSSIHRSFCPTTIGQYLMQSYLFRSIQLFKIDHCIEMMPNRTTISSTRLDFAIYKPCTRDLVSTKCRKTASWPQNDIRAQVCRTLRLVHQKRHGHRAMDLFIVYAESAPELKRGWLMNMSRWLRPYFTWTVVG